MLATSCGVRAALKARPNFEKASLPASAGSSAAAAALASSRLRASRSARCGVSRLQLPFAPEQLVAVLLRSGGQFLARLAQFLFGAFVVGDFLSQLLGGPGQLRLDSLAVGRFSIQLVRLPGKFRRPFQA